MLPWTRATFSSCSELAGVDGAVLSAVETGERSRGDTIRITTTAPVKPIDHRRAGAPPTTWTRVTLMSTTINERPYTPATAAIGRSALLRYCVYHGNAGCICHGYNPNASPLYNINLA